MDARLRIDFSRRRSRTGRLIGWNIGRGTLYAPRNDALHPAWRTPERVAAVAALRALRPANGDRPLMRFSGLQIDGALGGDGYHFAELVRPGRAAAPDDNMASFQFQALMEESQARPLITLNFGSGTAAEAARYVRHLTDASEPLAVQQLEIGNEVFGFWNTGYSADSEHSYANPRAPHGGDPPWHGRPASDPANYAARALEYVRAVEQVLPDARLWIPLCMASMDSWGGIDLAVEALEPLLQEPSVEAAVVHHYQVDDAEGLADKNSAEFILCGSEFYRPSYLRLRRRLDEVPRAVPLQLAITEYHVAGAFARGQFHCGATPVVGLGLADMLLLFAQLGVEHACQHIALNFLEADDPQRDVLLEPWYNPFETAGEGRIASRPGYRVTRLFAEHLLRHTATLEERGVPRTTLQVGKSRFAMPLLHGVAFVDEAAEQGSLVLLHRDLANTRPVELEVEAGWQVQSGLQYAPESYVFDADAEVIPLQWTQQEGLVRIVARPHSLIALRFSRR